MRVLLIHNRYQQAGGEDSVFRSESEMLLTSGHSVRSMVYENSTIKSVWDKFLSGLRSIYNPLSAEALKKVVKDFMPDVIHVHNFLPLVSPSVFWMANRLGVPVVLTLHNYRLICPSATLFHEGHIYEKSIRTLLPLDAIWKGVYRNSRMQTAVVALITGLHHLLGTWRFKVDGYITLTQFAREKIARSPLLIPTGKLFVKPNFVEDSGEGEATRANFFLFIGRLTEEKGIRVLLNAAEHHHFKLVIIGDGPLRKLVLDAAIENVNIHYLGTQGRPLVMSYLKKCKALIFPSIWYEGFPVTILEAFSTSTPVIASNLGGMKEIIQDGINGLHFEPGNAEELVSKIVEISSKDDLARRLSEQARLTYLNHYGPGKNCTQLVNIYSEVIERGRKQRNPQKRFKIAVSHLAW